MSPLIVSRTLCLILFGGAIGLADQATTQPTPSRGIRTAEVLRFDLKRAAKEGADWSWPAKAVPLVSVRHGPTRNGRTETKTATGIIAIGDIAVGVVAIGGISVGVLSVGGVSIGVLSVGGVALAWLFALGGVAYAKRLALGAVATGGFGVGAVAIGRTAFGIVAIGARGWGIIPLTGTVVRLFRRR